MPPSIGILPRSIPAQLALAAVGMVAFVIYARSWKDFSHLAYDIPASFAVFAFIAQLLLEAGKDGAGWNLGIRLALVVAMTVATVGREFLAWPISGHLTCLLAVALVQLADPRLPTTERLLYWLPVPIVLFFRWHRFDGGNHWQTYNAVLFACVGATLVILATRSAPS